MKRGKDRVPKYAIDMETVVPSKLNPAITLKHRKAPERPEKIEAMLQIPEKRKFYGPCCVSADGTVRGTKKWGDGKGSEVLKGDPVFICGGCMKLLDRPGTTTQDDLDAEDEMWAEAEKMAEQAEKKQKK